MLTRKDMTESKIFLVVCLVQEDLGNSGAAKKVSNVVKIGLVSEMVDINVA